MSPPLLECRGLVRSFGVTRALGGVDLDVHAGEVLGLIGENGAGKSTLLRILAGHDRPDEGEIALRGEPYRPATVRRAHDLGVGMVMQEQSLLPNLTVAQNMFLGVEHRFSRRGLIDRSAMVAEARRQLAKTGCDIDPARVTETLPFAQRQLVELAKVLALEDRAQRPLLILLDEPTTVLGREEIDQLFARVRALRDRAAFIFVSHRLDEVLALSDRVCVLRDGETVTTLRAAEATPAQLHREMVGRDAKAAYYRSDQQSGPGDATVLEVEGLHVGEVCGVDLRVRAGEVLGLYGVEGSGVGTMCRVLAGARRPRRGILRLDGREVRWDRPGAAVADGVGYVPKERRAEGIVGSFDVAANLSLANIRIVERRGVLRRGLERGLAEQWIDRLHIKAGGPGAIVGRLSGGNQQKVVLGKWLAAGARVLILEHPTRGIDVGAKEEVYDLLRELTRTGVAVILVAETLDEAIGLSDTVVAMKDGRVQRTFAAPPDGKPSEEEIVACLV